MKINKLSFLSLALLLLVSCSGSSFEPDYTGDEPSLPTLNEDGTLTYTDTYSMDGLVLEENTLTKTNVSQDNIRNYFMEYGVNFADDTTYIFLYKASYGSRDFKIDLTYDTAREENPYYIAITWYLDDPDNLPDAYYFYSTYFNVTDFKQDSYQVYYYYDYSDSESDYNEAYVPLTYNNISYATAPMITSVSYTLETGTSFPSRGTRDEETLATEAFETIRVASSFLEEFLTTIDSSYHLW